MTTQDHESWNEAMARRYNPDAFITKTGACIRWVESIRIRKTIQLLGSRAGDSVLDVGCGPGNLTQQLIGSSVIGIDLSDTLLDQARAKVRGKAGFSIQKGNAEALAFGDNSFDRVVCSEVLEHVKSPDKSLQEIHRVSKPGARVVITLPNESLINATKRVILMLGLKKWVAGEYDMSDNMLDEWHVNEIEPPWVRRASRFGFDLTHEWKAPFFFAPYHRLFGLTVKK